MCKMCDISDVKNLACACKEDQKRFFNSFDHVLSDLDGVVWLAFKPYPGAADCIANLKKIGKSVAFVTNNSTVQIDAIHQLLQKFKVPVKQGDVVNPSVAYIEYLKNIQFNKMIFAIGGQGLKDDLTKAGFTLAPNSATPIEETLPGLIEAISDNEEIGAVIMDYDINLTIMKLQKCLTYLKRKDCLFIVGTGDKSMPFTHNGPLIGNYYFFECLKEISGRKPLQMAKPSSDFNDFIVDNYGITDPKRVLFIGDSINEDMKFASVGGYKKLLVLSGSAKKEDIIIWKHGEAAKPDYYVESMGALNLILGILNVK